MKNKIRLIPLGLSLAFFISFMSSCQNANSTGKEKSIVVWHWLTDREEAFLELAKKYEESTGVQVDFQLYAPSDTYTQKVRIGAQTKTLPDIYGILGEPRDLADFVKAGVVEDLTPSLGKGKGSWKSSFYPEALNSGYLAPSNQFGAPSGYYGIPFDVTTIPMIYSKPLFKKAGLDPQKPPQTWDEFVKAGQALRESGVTGFVSGWGETWLIFSMATSMAHNVMGTKKVMDTFRGTVPYTDPDWMKVFTAFESLQKAGFSSPSLITMGNKKSEQSFATGRSGITFNGSWGINVYAAMNPDLDYSVFPVPSLNPKNPSYVWGGAGTIFYVNALSKKKEISIEFLKWLSQKEQAAYLVKATKNLPAVRGLENEISPIMAEFSSLMENSIHPNRFEASEHFKVQDVFNRGLQAILIGQKTPRQVAEEIQKAKEKVKSRKA